MWCPYLKPPYAADVGHGEKTRGVGVVEGRVEHMKVPEDTVAEPTEGSLFFFLVFFF